MAYKLPSLYAFSLPGDLISQLEPRKLVIPLDHPLHPSNQQPELPPAIPTANVEPNETKEGGAYKCALTGASFADLQGLKEHYRTDWYKYNVKLKLQGKATPVSEQEFNSMVDNLSDSISGSESTSTLSDLAEEIEDSASSAEGTLSRILRKQSLLRPEHSRMNNLEDDDEQDPLSGPRTALLWFEAPQHAPDTQYGVYRAILPTAGSKALKRQSDDSPEILQELKNLQLDPAALGEGAGEGQKERKWTLLMFGGGHFAGMVVKLNPKLVSKGKGKEKEKELVILEKKTFHRYTTRRKQGGSQGMHDSGNGKAKSAGAQIRRHNEAALTDEVRELLNDWREEIDDSELIFLRCSKSYYRVFMGYDDAVLTRGDPRIRGFTFPTRRPTIAELVRAFQELTKVKTSHLTASALAELDASYLSSIAPPPSSTQPSQPPASTKPKPVVKKLTKLEELERDRWTRLIEMVSKGKVEAVDNFLDKYGPELESGSEQGKPWGTLPEWTEEYKGGRITLLHVASAADQKEMVRWLLEVKRADPTLQHSTTTTTEAENEEEENKKKEEEEKIETIRTPYELARSKGTRNEFRFMTMQHPDWWDWTGTGVGGARVPSGLDEAKEREKEAKEEAKREKLREKQREREAAEAEEFRLKDLERQAAEDKERREREERLANLPTKGPKRLGGGPPQVIQQRQMGNLTEEQKMRIQREERARAAEARLKRLG
ncbi:Vms1p [Sporobolomyces salmoneus]|uniref:Vms1p n=1 Tax=Sporobolomyces salmoneus TaxID=183962 RepID=UPI003171E257